MAGTPRPTPSPTSSLPLEHRIKPFWSLAINWLCGLASGYSRMKRFSETGNVSSVVVVSVFNVSPILLVRTGWRGT
jgi:hypothetical protein